MLIVICKHHEGKIYQRNYLPRVLLDGQSDPNEVAARHSMYETITRAMSATLANHNEIFLTSLTNAMKEALSMAATQPKGPAYPNHNMGPKVMTNIMSGNSGQASGGASVQQGGAQQGGAQQGGQHSVQQPMVNYGTCQSAAKFAPGYKKIIRDFNAPPYQGRVAPGELPPGYHYVSEYYTLDANENPRYQGAPQGSQNSRQQNRSNSSGQNVVMNQVDELMSQVTEMVQRQFGLKPKNSTITYRKPYPSWYDHVVLPPRYRMPDFVKFNGTGTTSTLEHISQYLVQLGELSDELAFRVRFFPLSLSGPAFSWFASLPYDSIVGWEDLENKFHQYFDSGVAEKSIIDLVNVRHGNSEFGSHYLQRFRDVRNQCYSLTLSEAEVVSIAIRGLLPAIREKIVIDYPNLGALSKKLACIDAQYRYTRFNKPQKATKVGIDPIIQEIDDDGSESEEEIVNEVAAVDWA